MKKTEFDDLTLSAQSVINYILESEHEDFLENPSTNHVYYHALVVFEGKKAADKLLKEAVKDCLDSLDTI